MGRISFEPAIHGENWVSEGVYFRRCRALSWSSDVPNSKREGMGPLFFKLSFKPAIARKQVASLVWEREMMQASHVSCTWGLPIGAQKSCRWRLKVDARG